MQYESPITSGLKLMAKVKVFVHATDANADSSAMTLAPRTYLSQLANNEKAPLVECACKISSIYIIHNFEVTMYDEQANGQTEKLNI